MNPDTQRYRTLWLCTALHAFTHMYQVALIPLYLLIQKEFKLTSEGQATFLVTALSIAYFLPSYGMGILADRVSRKKLLGYGLLLNALAFIGLAYAPNYPVAVGCVILAGLGGSFYHPAATALTARLFPEATGKALGRVGIGAGLGFFVAPLYAGWRAAGAGWRQPVLELGLMGLAGAILFFWLADEEKAAPVPKATASGKPAPVRMFPTTAMLGIFLVASLLFCLRDFAGSGMVTLGSLFLQHAHGFDTQKTGLVLSCIYPATMISNPLFGSLSDGGRVRWAVGLLLISAVVIFIFPHAPAAGAIPLLALYGFFFMASYPIVEAMLMEAVPDAVRGRVFGCFITIGGLLGNLSHWLIGVWVRQLGEAGQTEKAGYYKMYALLAVFILISLGGLACLHALRRRESAVTVLTPVTAPPLNPEA